MKFFKITTLAVSVLAGASFAFSQTALANEHEEKIDATYRLMNLFSSVFQRVKSDYVDERSDEEIVEAAIAGMLASLDPHSSFMNKNKYKDMQVNTRGAFGGLGIQVSMEKGFVKVISPIDDTPAFRAGVEAGDIIIKLDGVSIQGFSLNEAVEKMRGKVGSDIRLTVVRDGEKEPFDITITRAVIKITSVRKRIEGNVGYVRITQFTEQTESGLKKAMKSISDELGDKLQGIVLDLRNNPGGLLNQAINVSDAFLDKGEIVSTRSRNPEDTQRFNARPGDLANGLPLVVLINGGSASASEIVAGALKDHRRAILLGTRSFGKGSVQTIIPLPGYGAMRLTTARYYTPSGRSIQGLGVDPDIIVEQSRVEALKTPTRRREADLRGALKNTDDKMPGDAKKDSADNSAEKTDKAAKEQDYQLLRALDLIRGVSLLNNRQAAKVN